MNRDRQPVDAAPDLEAHERGLAAWFGRLDRPGAPARLRQAVLDGAPARGGRLHPAWLRAFPLGAWGVASAAVLLLALGLAVTVELAAPIRGPATQTAGGQVSVVEDATMPLFHDLETFDDVGLPPGELIADWGR